VGLANVKDPVNPRVSASGWLPLDYTSSRLLLSFLLNDPAAATYSGYTGPLGMKLRMGSTATDLGPKQVQLPDCVYDTAQLRKHRAVPFKRNRLVPPRFTSSRSSPSHLEMTKESLKDIARLETSKEFRAALCRRLELGSDFGRCVLCSIPITEAVC